MTELRFLIPGKAVGYYTMGKHPNFQRRADYYAYADRVRWEARQAGASLPLVASELEPLFIETRMRSLTRVHHDPENVAKGICDALFYAGKNAKRNSSDKYCGGQFHPSTYGDNEGVAVLIRPYATLHAEDDK